MVLATLSCSKFEIIQLLREESALKFTVIRNMSVANIFTRGRSLEDFFRSNHKDLSKGAAKSSEISFFLLNTKKTTFFC